MLRLRSAAEFRRDPSGGFVHGERWFYFAFDPGLFGYVIWGSPEPADIYELVDVLVSELDRPPHEALVHLGDLEVILPEAFQALADYTVTHSAQLARIVTRTAIVRPPGVNGAIVSGFFDMASRPFPVTFAMTCDDALALLGGNDIASRAEELRAVREQLAGEPALVRRLRRHLAENLVTPSLAEASEQLALSPRTLQRRLADASTSFEAEVQRARLVAAERRLLESDEPVTTLALGLGFATSQHFSTLFRKHFGEAPSELRKRRRAR
jgi:AraC-like DNA-binding protein